MRTERRTIVKILFLLLCLSALLPAAAENIVSVYPGNGRTAGFEGVEALRRRKKCDPLHHRHPERKKRLLRRIRFFRPGRARDPFRPGRSVPPWYGRSRSASGRRSRETSSASPSANRAGSRLRSTARSRAHCMFLRIRRRRMSPPPAIRTSFTSVPVCMKSPLWNLRAGRPSISPRARSSGAGHPGG